MQYAPIIIPIYILIGIVYLLINVLIRKLDTEGDYLLPNVWMFFWPLCLLALLIRRLDKTNFENI